MPGILVTAFSDNATGRARTLGRLSRFKHWKNSVAVRDDAYRPSSDRTEENVEKFRRIINKTE